MRNNANKAKQEATTNFVPEQRGNRMFQINYPHASVDRFLSALTFETPKFRQKYLSLQCIESLNDMMRQS